MDAWKRNRVHVLRAGSASSMPSGDMQAFAERFASAAYPERLEIVKGILSMKEKEDIGDMEIREFVHLVESLLHAKLAGSDPAGKKHAELARVFVTVGEYLFDASSSKKLLLEYMALRLPVL